MGLDLANAVRTASAVRFDVALQPPGGPLHKVFPPTYPSPKEAGRSDMRPLYATEMRLIDGEQVTAALLDSVPSQANRLELALLDARRAGRVHLPLIEVSIDGYGTITDLDAPHRVYDAILIDSLLQGQPFLKSPIGSQLGAASASNATALFTYSPTALIFGAWNSHAGQHVGMARFPRALTSEIIAWPVIPGVKTASRIDPLGITKSAGDGMYETEDGRWTFDPERARKEKNKPVAARPSRVGHGNVAPSLDREIGGISILHARQTAVLTLVQLRHLHFPDSDGAIREERDVAARTVLAALALVALLEQWDGGYQLRSGCLLQPLSRPTWNLCGRTANDDVAFDLDTAGARALLQKAMQEAARHNLTWAKDPVRLVASAELRELVRRNTALLGAGEPDEE